MKREIPINLMGGVSQTIICSQRKSGVANILPLNPVNQHYTAFMTIDEKTDTDEHD